MKLPVYLEIGEVKALMDEAYRPRDKLIVHILYKTGLRVHELTSLKIEHIDFEKNQMLVVAGKGDKDRFVDIDGELKADILSYIGTRRTGVVLQSHHTYDGMERFVVRQGRFKASRKTIRLEPQQMSDRTIENIIATLVKATGIIKAKKITPHTLRHTFACQSLLAGVPLTSIKEALGHSSLSTTQIYLFAIQDRRHVKDDYEHHPLPKVN